MSIFEEHYEIDGEKGKPPSPKSNQKGVDSEDYLNKTVTIGKTAEGKKLLITIKALIQGLRVIGGPGSGKSTFIEHLCLKLIEEKATLILIDPHKSLFKFLRDYLITNGRADLLIEFNADVSDIFLTAFNPFILNENDNINVVADKIISLIAKAWNNDLSQQPRINKWLYLAIYVLLEQKLTILELKSLITPNDNAKRKKIISKIKSNPIKKEWQYFDQLSRKQREELIEGAENRLNVFIRSDFIRKTVSQGKSLDLKKVMDSGKVVVLNLYEGNNKLGTQESRFFAASLLNSIFNVGMSRKAHVSRPVFLVIDECHKFLSDTIADILYQLRKFSIGLILGHQSLSQIDEEKHGKIIKEALSRLNIQVAMASIEQSEATDIAESLFSKIYNPYEIFFQRSKKAYRNVLKNTTQTIIREEVSHYETSSQKEFNSSSCEFVSLNEQSLINQSDKENSNLWEEQDTNKKELKQGTKYDESATKLGDKDTQEVAAEYRLKGLEPHVNEYYIGTSSYYNENLGKNVYQANKAREYPKNDEEFKKNFRDKLGFYPQTRVPIKEAIPFKEDFSLNSKTNSSKNVNKISNTFQTQSKSINSKIFKNSKSNVNEKSKNMSHGRKVEKIHGPMLVPEEYEEIAEMKLMPYETFIRLCVKKLQNLSKGQAVISIMDDCLEEKDPNKLNEPVKVYFAPPIKRPLIYKKQYQEFVKSMIKRYSFVIPAEKVIDSYYEEEPEKEEI